MKNKSTYQQIWNREFEKLSQEQKETIIASPDGKESAKLAVRVTEILEAQ